MSVPLPDEDFARRVRQVTWVLSDVDGVLTDGRLHYGAKGEELKAFNVKDGMAVELAHRAELKVGFLSARASEPLFQRARELGIDATICGRQDKDAAFSEFLAQEGLVSAQVAYIGDDLTDLPIVTRAGLSFAPSDAAEDVQRRVDHVLTAAGGSGAMREVVELLLRARGEWELLLQPFQASN